jgi:hypothetical protein
MSTGRAVRADPASSEPSYNRGVSSPGARVAGPACRSAIAAALALSFVVVCGRAQPQREFAARIAALSEAGGYFDTDNLISNERSYLQVLPDLRRAGVSAGIYIGVGPDQNFSYIAALRPRMAFIVDVRRDNLLLHLLFKALFELSRTRIEYVSLLFGRDVPASLSRWSQAPIDRIVAQADRAAATHEVLDTRRVRLEAALKRFGVPLSGEDLATIARFHQRFIEAGPDLRFQSAGRPPQPYYPTYRELLLQTDPDGRQANYLASEESFQFVKSLEARDLVVPVVGDLSGPSALAAIGRLLRQNRQQVSAFYVSNVELYLFREGAFGRYARNLEDLPIAPGAVLIRAVFGRYSMYGRGSTTHLQPIDDLIRGFKAGRIRGYEDLMQR